MTTPPTVRQATAADADLVADTLAEAFLDDPFLVWLFPDDRRRPALLFRYFHSISRSFYLHHRQSFLTDGGAALWLPPHVRADAIPVFTFLGMLWRMWWACGFAGLQRARTVSEVMAAQHPTEPHYYLHAIGVRKSKQGQGVGSALIRQVTQRCDAEGMLAYLENSNPRNTPLYERHGFRIAGEWRTDTGVPIWFMRREPAPAV